MQADTVSVSQTVINCNFGRLFYHEADVVSSWFYLDQTENIFLPSWQHLQPLKSKQKLFASSMSMFASMHFMFTTFLACEQIPDHTDNEQMSPRCVCVCVCVCVTRKAFALCFSLKPWSSVSSVVHTHIVASSIVIKSHNA